MKSRLILVAALAVLATAMPATASSEKEACTFGDAQALVQDGFGNGFMATFDAFLERTPEASNAALLDGCVFDTLPIPPEAFQGLGEGVNLIFTSDDWIVGQFNLTVLADDLNDLTRKEAIARLEAVELNVAVSDEGEEFLIQKGRFPSESRSFWREGGNALTVESTGVKFAPNLHPAAEYDDNGDLIGISEDEYSDAWRKVWYVLIAPGELPVGEYQFKACTPTNEVFQLPLYALDEEVCGFTNVEILAPS